MIQNILYNNWRFVNLAILLRGFIDEVFEEMSSMKKAQAFLGLKAPFKLHNIKSCYNGD